MNLVHFFHFLTLHFWDHFWPFLTLYCASDWAHGPHLDHHLEVYYLSVESAKKWTLIIDSVQFFDFFSFKLIFCRFRTLGGSLGAPKYSWGAPQGPYEKLNLNSNPHPVSGATASSIGQICGFLGSAPLTFNAVGRI